jgi:LPXTG-motif cell wall-anchored protein
MNLSRKILLTISILIALIGIVWFGQGIGMIHGSIMTDDSKWAVIGAIMIVVGLGIFLFAKKRK